jgi:hypothetical protein
MTDPFLTVLKSLLVLDLFLVFPTTFHSVALHALDKLEGQYVKLKLSFELSRSW